MKLLLDENVPQPLASTIRILLQSKHEVVHVIDLAGWGGTKDISLYDQAAGAGYAAILTNDAKQMKRKPEVEAIAKSGIHRVQYPHRHGGLLGVGLAMATICAALPIVLAELESAPGQRLDAGPPLPHPLGQRHRPGRRTQLLRRSDVRRAGRPG